MHAYRPRLSNKRMQQLRSDAGRWLCELRKKRDLSQSQLAQKVGVEFYTFIAQFESGRGRIPPSDYLLWADALGVEPREFVTKLMSYYEPLTHEIIFGSALVHRSTSGRNASAQPRRPGTGLPHASRL